jgi:UDP-3-O-[3-hydroxymyristoyl] N-acetylglucosamine deacetylase
VIEDQVTIKKKIVFSGLGLHSGLAIKATLIPSKVNSGIFFVRTDLKKTTPIKACWKNTVQANLCTKISNKEGDTVSTVEHLMFALYSLGITNLLIEINGPEVPIMDGSAKNFIDEILKNGLIKQNEKFKKLKILKSFEISIGKKFIKYYPSNKNFLEIDYTLEYNDQFIKKQKYLLKDAKKNFLKIFDCRTFCHQEDLEKIFAMGLAKGGSLDNAIVISGNKILNQDGLRCADEFVKHKILDCIGDLYLCGFFIQGKIICRQGGHELTLELLKKIFEDEKNYVISSSQLFAGNKASKNFLHGTIVETII